MTLAMRRIYVILISLISGLMAWPGVEYVISRQEEFPSYLYFCLVLGGMTGIFMGAIFGSMNGLIHRNIFQLVTGIFTGLIIGCLGGAAGMLAAQGMYFAFNIFLEHENLVLGWDHLPAVRVLGWSLIGSFCGMVEGVRSLSLRKMKYGFFGGLIGGLSGALVIEYTRDRLSLPFYSRLIGLAVMGLVTGLAYSFLEREYAGAGLLVLNGSKRGREYLLSRESFVIGKAAASDLSLVDYSAVAARHARIVQTAGGPTLRPVSSASPVWLNGSTVERALLKPGDVIGLGEARLLCRYV